jgi:tetratricopeptide (TPR) repeat protein
MGRVEKTVFISYRRTNAPWALAISQNLTHHGYDVFFDFTGIKSGDFESAILGNIEARAHFVVLLTPSALKRCGEPGDWLRREIETALELKRNMVPLTLEGFSFKTRSIAKQLTGTLAVLKSYQALSVPMEYFDAAMERLRKDYLNVALDAVQHPASAVAREAARVEQAAVNAAPAVKREKLTAQEWFERGFNATNPDDEIDFYSEAVRLQPDFAEAFYNRGIARKDKGDMEGAERDFEQAIGVQPDYAAAFNNRGVARKAKHDLDGALQDYDEAIRLQPDFAIAFNNRGNARKDKGDLEGALQDYDEAIRLKSDYAGAFYNRGSARADKGDPDGAIADYTEAIRLKPDYAEAFYNRGNARKAKGDPDGAIADFIEAIRFRPDYAKAFNNRSGVRKAKGDLDGAIQDLNEAIRLMPDFAEAFYNRALIWKLMDRPAAAIADFQKYLDFGGGARDGDAEEVENKIRDLKKKL